MQTLHTFKSLLAREMLNEELKQYNSWVKDPLIENTAIVVCTSNSSRQFKCIVTARPTIMSMFNKNNWPVFYIFLL